MGCICPNYAKSCRCEKMMLIEETLGWGQVADE